MFSSFVARVTAGLISPKALLASFLASSLGEYFVLDPAQVESSLLSGTKIILKALQLKKLRIGGAAEGTLWLDGVVDEVEFSWIWGGDEASPFIRETLLTIRGARVRVFCSSSGGNDGTSEHYDINTVDLGAASTRSSSQKLSAEEGAGYLERQMQQVMDHLTLNIVDFELIIEIPTSDLIVVQSKSLCLVSYGREEKDGFLSQRISLDSLTVFIPKTGSDSELPLVESIGYAATVTRVSGRRFMDGFMTGIEIVGESLDYGELIIHLGCQQAKVVSSFVEMMIESSCGLSSSIPEREVEAEQATIRIDKDSKRSTSIILPLPSLMVIISEDCNLKMPGCTFHYRVNGTECRLDGIEGITLNEECKLLHVEDGVVWCLDVATSTISVRGQGKVFKTDKAAANNDRISAKFAHIQWNETHVKRFLRSLQEVAKSASQAVIRQVEGTVLKEVEAWQMDHKGSTWNIQVEGSVTMRIEGEKGEWVDAKLEASSAELTADGLLRKISIGPATVGPTSFGGISLYIPAGDLVKNTKCLHFQDAIRATVVSTSAVEELTSFLQRVASFDELGRTLNGHESTPSIALPIEVRVQDVNVILTQPHERLLVANKVNISSKGDISIESLVFTTSDDDNTKVQATSVVFSPTQMSGSVGEIKSVVLPNVVSLSNPVSDVSFQFEEGVLQIKASLIHVNPCWNSTRHHKKTAKDTEASSLYLPFPVRFQMEKIRVSLWDQVTSLRIRSLDVGVCQNGDSIIVESESIKLRFEQSKNSWIQVMLGKSQAFLGQSEPGQLTLTELKHAGIAIGPSSFGQFAMRVPEFEIKGEQVHVCDKILVDLESQEVARRVQNFVQALVSELPNAPSSLPPANSAIDIWPVVISEVIIKVQEPNIAIVCQGIYLEESLVQCEVFQMSEASDISLISPQFQGTPNKAEILMLVSGSKVSLQPPYSATIDCVETLCVPGVFRLEKPIQIVHICYDMTLCKVKVPNLHLILLPSPKGTPTKTKSKIAVPFAFHLSVDEIGLNMSPSSGDLLLVREVEIGATATPPDPFVSEEQQTAGIELSASAAWIGNGMGHLELAKTSGQVLDGNLNEIRNLNFSSKAGSIMSGVSTIDWSSLFSRRTVADSEIMNLPLCCVEAMDLHLEYKGAIVGTTTSVRIPKFVGGPKTTSKELGQHFINAVVNKAPSFVTNATIMGQNTSEMAGQRAGLMAMGSSSLMGSVAGSVSGLVAVDGIRAAIAGGKKHRGVSDNDSYKFGDLTRGSLRAISQATQSGAELRRGDSGRYEVGDFSTGVARSSSAYVSENKKRLGAAGGSGIGIVVGAALLGGPIGFVAGSMAGSMAGSRASGNDVKAGGNETIENQPKASDKYKPKSEVAAEEGLLQMGMPLHCADSEVLRPSNPSEYQHHKQQQQQNHPTMVTHQQQQQQLKQQQQLQQQQQQQEYCPIGTTPYPTHHFDGQGGHQQYQQQQTHSVTATQQQQYHPTGTTQYQPSQYQASSFPSEGNQGKEQHCSHNQTQRISDPNRSNAQDHLQQPQQQQQPQVYRFGDLTRSVVAKGKKNAGRNGNDGYKFGDFTRGLFG